MGGFMWNSIPLENTVFGVRLFSGTPWAFSNGDTLTIFMARKSINYNDN